MPGIALCLRTAAACCAFFAAAAGAQPALSLTEAQSLAVERSRQPAAHAAAAQAAREMAVAAGQRPDPQLRVGVANVPLEGPDRLRLGRDGMTMGTIGLMQELTRGDKRAARSRRFGLEALAGEAAAENARAALRRDAGLAWLDAVFQHRALELLRRQREEAGLQEEAALAAVRAGRGGPVEVIAARQASAQLDDRMAEAEREARMARVMLARWIGDAARRPLAGDAALPAPPVLASDHALEVQAHPQLRALEHQIAAAQAEAAVADAARRPDWTVEVMVGRRGPAFDDMLSVNFAVPLQLQRGQRQDRELAARQAEADRLREEHEEALRGHLAEARGLSVALASTADRLRRHDRTLLPLAADRVQAALAAYRGGGTLAAVLEARRAEVDARLDRLKLEREAARVQLQLDYLLAGHGARP